MKTLLILAVILIALGLIKVGVHIWYVEKNVRLELLIFRFKMVLMGEDKPEKKQKKKPKEKKKEAPKPEKQKKTAAKPKKKGSMKPLISAVLQYWREILGIIGRVLTMPTLDILRAEICVGNADAEKCALTYGKCCAIVGAVLPVVENTFRVKKRDIQVRPCFDRESLEIQAEAAVTVRIYEVFALVFALLGLGIKILLQARTNKKAVQV